jgi:DNA-binding transcriptional LysR family regulator
MEFRPLRAFVEVVRQGGFSQAAPILLTTQSSVSKAVKQLEDELGSPLLNRTGHRCQLTPVGEIVYRRGVKLLAERDDLLAEIDDTRAARRGGLRIGLPPFMDGDAFAAAIAEFRSHHPSVEIRLFEEPTEQLEQKLRSGEADLAVMALPISAEFDWQPFCVEPLVALLPSNHPCAARPELSLAALNETPFILPDRDAALNHVVLEASRRAGFEPEIAAHTSQIALMIKLVSIGLGAGFLTRAVAARQLPAMNGSVAICEIDLALRTALAWRRDTYLSSAALAWLTILAGLHDHESASA